MKVGIFGTGDISHAFMEAAGIAGVEVIAVYNRNYEKAQAFCEKYGLKACYDDPDQLVSNQEIDTVYVGMPNGLHYTCAMKGLEAGKNVIIEKPFCANLREFNELCSKADEKKRFIIEMDRIQSLPNFKAMKEHLDEVGFVSAVSANYSQYSRKYDAYLQGNVSNVFTTEFAGGALMDLGVYPINAIIALFGMPTKVIYRVNKLGTGVDIAGDLLMEYPGFHANVIVAKNSIGNKHIMIQGTEGSIITEDAPSTITNLTLMTRWGNKDISADQPYDGFAYTLMDIKNIIENRDMTAYSARRTQSRRVMTILDAARRSANIVFSADWQG